MRTEPVASGPSLPENPWPALWALVIGFFMILVDTTIVSVANPAIKAALDPNTPNLDRVVWVTSAYLLAYAVPLLVTGRLGDKFGPKKMYLTGLTVFTLASLGCGLSRSLEMLVIMRAVQGLGASLVAPQTMAVIARTFPADRRGAAMGLWGATAGVAALVGPLLGGFLVDGFGWEWIFFINLPVSVVGFILAMRLVPALETHDHRFDLAGVALSGAGLFLIVFGLQEGEQHDWAPWVWGMIATGVAVMAVFVRYQARTRSEPLVPLSLFRLRNFTVSNIGVAAVGFTVTGMSLPLMFFLQLARGLSPTQSAMLLIPQAVLSGVLAPYAGRLLDRHDPRVLLVPGLGFVALGLGGYALLMSPQTPIWMFLIPSALMGIGNAGMWGPLATTANRDLPPHQAGAGSGVYNTTRTVGSVLGSAAIAAFMQNRLAAHLPGAADAEGFGQGALPPLVADGFAAAMSQALLLPNAAILLGVIAVLFLQRPAHLR
ncbi:MAG: DHA2 family efflux MFS transporter permease subunit [Propioniciclava sp.]|uniref:DHA2 family efflux MFS transporter permease subunit n=1 Tax=Propioniciclava sp. TaxID=2038686 RepID=UPI0039E27996